MIDSLIQRVTALHDALRSGEIVREVLIDKADYLIERQQTQLWDGKNSSGEDLHPTYLQDPYFESQELARRYMAWKGEITPNTKRSPEVPNLYINGKFYNELDVFFNEVDIVFDGATAYAQKIVRKYGREQFGLMRSTWDEIMQDNKMQIMDRVKQIIYG